MPARGRSDSGIKPAISLPLFLILAVIVTWPLVSTPEPHDHADTLFNSWLIAWNNHAIVTGQNPLDLPIFEGFHDGNGRNDLLLTQSIIALPLQLSGMNAIRIHNILLVLFLAFAGFASALLARETGGNFYGSLFTGCVVILLPYFQSHIWHLQLFSVGLSILAVVYAIRVLKGKCRGWQLAVLVFLQCLASLYHWYFLNLVLLLLLITTALLPQKKHIVHMTGWWLAGNLVSLPFLLPHLKNAHSWSINSITSTDIAVFISPWGSSFLLGWMRPDCIHPEAALWPGLAVVAGSLWFLLKGKKNKWDIFLLFCLLFFAVFSLGPTLVMFGKAVAPAPFRLIAKLPGCSSIRLPARAGIFAILPLVIFAGRKLGEKPQLAITGVVLAVATVWHAPLRTIPLEPLPWHQWLAGQNFDTVLYLPVSTDMNNPQAETRRLISSIGHFTHSVNGYSTTLPADFENYARILNDWPADNARLLVEELGVDCLIIKGWQAFEADTVFFTSEMPVSAVVTRRL